MATTKKRINISADRNMETALKYLSKRDKLPMAAKAADLINTALEIEEDIVLSGLAEERLRQNGKYIAHKLAWNTTK